MEIFSKLLIDPDAKVLRDEKGLLTHLYKLIKLGKSEENKNEDPADDINDEENDSSQGKKLFLKQICILSPSWKIKKDFFDYIF